MPAENSQIVDSASERARLLLAELKAQKRISPQDIAAELHFSVSLVTEWATGQRAIDPWYADLLARAYGVNKEWLETGQGRMFPGSSEVLAPVSEQFAFISLYSVKAGAGAEKFVLSEEPMKLLAFRLDWIRSELRRNPTDLILLTVDGESMMPTLLPGEVVLVDRTIQSVSAEAIYLVRVDDGIMVKRAAWQAGALHLISDNPAYPRRVIVGNDASSGVAILGRVIWGGRRY